MRCTETQYLTSLQSSCCFDLNIFPPYLSSLTSSTFKYSIVASMISSQRIYFSLIFFSYRLKWGISFCHKRLKTASSCWSKMTTKGVSFNNQFTITYTHFPNMTKQNFFVNVNIP